MKSPLLDLQQVHFELPRLAVPILQNIDYSIGHKDFVILLGSNGSGKSSLLKILDRRYHPTRGTVMFEQRKLDRYSVPEFSRRVVTLTQHCMDSLFGSLTIFDNCLLAKQRGKKSAFFRMRTRRERVFFRHYLEKFNVNVAEKLDTSVSFLSGGEQQTLALALCVLNPPQVLLLDEHTSALDPLSAKRLMQITQAVVEQHEMTCILSTHQLDIALHYGNRILALSEGKVLKCIESEEKQMLTQQDFGYLYSGALQKMGDCHKSLF